MTVLYRIFSVEKKSAFRRGRPTDSSREVRVPIENFFLILLEMHPIDDLSADIQRFLNVAQ